MVGEIIPESRATSVGIWRFLWGRAARKVPVARSATSLKPDWANPRDGGVGYGDCVGEASSEPRDRQSLMTILAVW